VARINIEECWWSDPRRTKLLLRIGFAADGAAVNMWRLAQEFWGKSRGLVPADVFFKLEHAQELIDAGLADVRERSVYVRGCSEYLEWHAEKREQASAAGKKSAEVRRKKSGSAQPKGGKGAKKTEREPNAIRTVVNGTEPSDSGSLSHSGSDSESDSRGIVPIASAPLNPIRTYCDEWKAKNGKSPDLPGKDIGQLDRLGKDLGQDRACALIRVYFSMPDSWFIKKGYDVATLLANLSAIQQFEASGKLVTRKVVEQVEEQVDKIQGTHRKPRRSIEELELEREEMLKGATQARLEGQP
jgi:hypothetical protein